MTDCYPTHVPNAFAAEYARNPAATEDAALPTLAQSRGRLPEPVWPANPPALACYWRAWELAFGNLRQPRPGSGLVANYLDPAFNDHLFLWDSVFMLMFGRYGRHAFDFQRTLDNFYAKQHPDGFICRELVAADGSDYFGRFDPAGTGPNLLAWCEWTHWRDTGDRDRLARVFPALVAYHQFYRKAFSWPDGGYFSSGWGCGMDNQPRLPAGCDEHFDHGHMTWVDTTLQAALSARLLRDMAGVLGREAEVGDLFQESAHLPAMINARLWNDPAGFYVDRFRDGAQSAVKSIGGFWSLLAGVASPAQVARLAAHLEDPRTFNRPHRVPTLSADHPDYDPAGRYWRGSVWSPTTYMVLRGLTAMERPELAHAIARNHLANVLDVFVDTGTLWENYAPEWALAGSMSRPEFVGWTGLTPIAVLFENVFGLRPADPGRLLWDVRLTEAHGVRGYPLGERNRLDLICAARQSPGEEPRIDLCAEAPMVLEVRWEGGVKVLESRPGATGRG